MSPTSPRIKNCWTRSQFTRTTRLGFSGLSDILHCYLIQHTTRCRSVDRSAPFFIWVFRTYGCRTDDTTEKSIIDLWPLGGLKILIYIHSSQWLSYLMLYKNVSVVINNKAMQEFSQVLHKLNIYRNSNWKLMDRWSAVPWHSTGNWPFPFSCLCSNTPGLFLWHV